MLGGKITLPEIWTSVLQLFSWETHLKFKVFSKCVQFLTCTFKLKKMKNKFNYLTVVIYFTSGVNTSVSGYFPQWMCMFCPFEPVLVIVICTFVTYQRWSLTFKIQRFYQINLWSSKDKQRILPRPLKVTQRWLIMASFENLNVCYKSFDLVYRASMQNEMLQKFFPFEERNIVFLWS